MKRIYYFLKTFKPDILTALLALIGILITQNYAPTETLKNGISAATSVIALLIIIYLRSSSKDFVFSALTWRRDKKKWIGFGNFELSEVENAYEITNADPGYIHSEVLSWNNYKISFDFKIAHLTLAVILRAVNLANYLMLQITLNGIRPHIRVNDGWVKQEADEAGLSFTEPLSLDAWYKCSMTCDKNTVTIRLLNKDRQIFDRSWIIPRIPVTYSYKHSEEHPTSYIQFPIALDYGSVGFRNSSHERAYIKNVLIEKI